MRRIVCCLVGIMVLVTSFAYAASLTSNASPVIVDLSSVSYKNITFSPPTRNLDIYNMDSAVYIYVDLKSSTNTADKSRCYLLGPGDSLSLYDFITDGISFIREGGTYGPARAASPVWVLATY